LGAVSILPGATSDRMPTISKLTSWLTNGTQVRLVWTKPSDTSGFVHYSIYRSTNAGFTNLSRINVWTNIANVNTTNIISTPGLSGYYFHVTALDNPQPPAGSTLTNESWYSPGTYILVDGTPVLYISKSVDHPVRKPYELLTYTIFYSNASPYSVRSAAIVDVLPVHVMLITNSAEISNTLHGGVANVFYSTNYGLSSWSNSGFDTSVTAPAIKKIMWTLSSNIPQSGKGKLTFKVIVK
jgi:uncharacterized repeat protein (TIGR01451 family)